MRRRHALLLLGLAVGAVVWLAWPGGGKYAPLGSGEEHVSPVSSERLRAMTDETAIKKPALRGSRAGAPTGGDVSVRVIGPRGQGLPFVQLLVHRAGRPPEQVMTNRSGRAHLVDEVFDGTTIVELDPTDTRERPRPYSQPVVKGRVLGRIVELRPSRGVPLTLQPLDAETGRPVEGVHWAITGNRGGLRDASTGAQTLWTKLGSFGGVRLRIVPPSGYVAWDGGQTTFESREEVSIDLDRPSPRAREAVIRYPLRPEAKLTLEVPRRRQGLARDLVVCGIEAGGRTWTTALAEFKEGEAVRVAGVPFLHGQEFTLLVVPRWIAVDLVGIASRDIGVASGDRARIATVFRWHEDGIHVPRGALLKSSLSQVNETEHTITFKWSDLAHGGHVVWKLDTSRDNDLPFEEPFGESEGIPSVHVRPGAIVVCVRRRSGEPVPNVNVSVGGRYGITGSDGTARLAKVSAGRHQAVADGSDLIRTVMTVHVAGGKEHRVTLREGLGATLIIHAVDAEGRDLPFAQVMLRAAGLASPARWFDRRRRAQRVDHFADHKGQRTFDHVGQGPAEVEATWAGMTGQSSCKIVEGETKRVTITVRRAK